MLVSYISSILPFFYHSPRLIWPFQFLYIFTANKMPQKQRARLSFDTPAHFIITQSIENKAKQCYNREYISMEPSDGFKVRRIRISEHNNVSFF